MTSKLLNVATFGPLNKYVLLFLRSFRIDDCIYSLFIDLGNPQVRSQETQSQDQGRAESRHRRRLAETGRQQGHAQEDDGEHPRQAHGLHQPGRQAGGLPPLQTLRVRLQVDGGLLRRKFTL